MMRKWYIKPIAAFLTMALLVTDAAPAVVRAEDETTVQEDILTPEEESSVQEDSDAGKEAESVQPEEQPDDAAVQAEDSGADEQSVPEAGEETADSPVMIGENGYGSLAEAVAAAKAGDTIIVKQDLEIGECLTVSRNLTITADGTDRKITRSGAYKNTLFQVSSGAQLSFGSGAENGKIILDGGARWVKEVEVEDEDNPGEKITKTVDIDSPAEEGALNQGTAAGGSMISIQNGSLNLMEDGVLQNNDLTGSGSAVVTSAGGSSRINIRGTVRNNRASKNGGAVDSNGYIDIYETARFSGNTAGGIGGVLNNWNGGVVTVNGGTFTGNKAAKGGVAYTDGKLEMQGGAMTGNTAEQGGAIYVASSNDGRSVLVYGGTVKENQAEDIYANTAYVKFKGNAEAGNVYLPEGKSLTVTGALSGSIGVTAAADPGEAGIAVARGQGYTLKESDAERISSVSDLYAVVFKTDSANLIYSPVIIETQPETQDRTEINETAKFSVKARAAAGTEVAYQWYECADAAGNSPEKIEGGTGADLEVTRSKPGVYYFYCELSAARASANRTDVVSVKFADSSSAEPPQITDQPDDISVDLQKEGTLSVHAEVEDGGTLSYQWYSVSDPEQETGTAVEGADGNVFTVPTKESGTFYYYCLVTNTNNEVANKTSSVRSRAAAVKVSETAVRLNGTAYSSLDDALAQIDGADGGTLEILKDVTMSRTVTVTAGSLTVKAADGAHPVIKLTKVLTGEAFVVTGGSLTVENVVLDGGAIWAGSEHSVLKRGTNNQGRSVNSPLITMKGGTVNLNDGTVLQNNVANWTSAGVVMSGGTLNISGAQLNDCYGGSHGGVIYTSGSGCTVNINGAKMLRNQARSSTGALCADLGTKVDIRDGEFAWNYTSGRGGALFINGTLRISGDTDIHDNYAGGNGGGIMQVAGQLTVDGGTIRNNTANTNGGAIASLAGTVTLNGGTISGNSASVNGNGLYLEAGVIVTDNHVPESVTDPVYSMRTAKVTLDGNGSGRTEEQTVRYLDLYDLPEFSRNGYKFLGWFTEKEGGEEIPSGSRVKTKTNQTFYAHWELTATNAITVEAQPESGKYFIEDHPELTVSASAETGEVSYQWYRCADETGAGAEAVGTDSETLALPSDAEEMGTYYYYCVLSSPEAVDVKTDVVQVEMISRNHASVPVFTGEPSDAELFTGEEKELSAEASVNDGGTVTYQWYAGNSEDPAQAQPVSGADEASYTVCPDEAGVKYYFVKAVNTKQNTAGEDVSAEQFSRGAKIISHRKISVEQLASDNKVLSQTYWNTYRVGTAADEDGYILSASDNYGNYGNNVIANAFDGKFNTFWETKKGGVVNRVDMTFSREVKIDRIAYATRQDWLAGRGYPTKLTVYSKNGEGDWQEAGVAVSQESGGYILFTLPETVSATALRFEFTESTFDNWASASELILLRDESTVLTGSAVIRGNAVPGSYLTVEPLVQTGPGAGFAEGIMNDSLSCQWQISPDGVSYTDIEGANQAAYMVKEDDRDMYIRAVLRDASGDYSGSIVSVPYRGSFQARLSGETAIGGILTPDLSYMTEEAEYRYQWQTADPEGDFENIENADGRAYTVRAEDAGKRIRAAVSVGDFTVYSDEAEILVAAVLTGAPQPGSTLTMSLDGVAEAGNPELGYQWQISPDGEDSFEDLNDGTESTYTIPENLEGQFIRGVITVKATGKKYESEAWEILAAGTIQDCEKDFVYLSDIPKSKISGRVGFGDLEFDRNTSKNRISLIVGGQKNYFMKGFGAHADATLLFDVSDYVKYYHYDRFIAYLGLDSAQGSAGNGVTFQVMTSSTTSDDSSFTTVKTTGVLKGNSEAVPVDIDLDGVKYLKIYIGTNGNAASDHSVVADAKLARKTYKNEDQTTDLFQTVEKYDEQIKQYEASHGGTHEELLGQDDYRKLLYQRTFVKAADYQMLKAYLYDESYEKTLRWFLNDMDALDLYVGGGAPDGSYANFVETLKNLYVSHGTDMDDAAHGDLYKKMIITIALTHSANVVYWADSSVKSGAVRRYEIYKKLYDNNLLLNDVFENLSVEEMRWVMNNISADEEIEWLNYYVRYHTNKTDPTNLTLDNFTPGPYYFIRYTMGFNYYQEKFYSESNKQMWQDKYSLTNETANPKVEPYDFNITYEKNKPRLWIVWEAGAVCGGISKTGTNLLTAFGVPGVVIGQPGHAAYFQYSETADGKGKWDIYNDISGFMQSEKGERMLNGWGNQSWKSFYNGSYLLLAQAALNEEDKYYTSQELVKLADVYRGEPEKQISIYREALDILPLNLDAWEKMVAAYEEAGKSSSDLLNLAEEISQALTYYPLPMRDMLMNLIGPKLSSQSDKAVLSIYVQAALRKAQNADSGNTLQPKYCISMANYLLGNTDYQVATFSFSGDKAGTVVLNDNFSGGNQLLISIDGGTDWIDAGVAKEYKFKEEELEKITAEKDILVKLQGTSSYYTIDITQGSKPSRIYNNDLENRITGDVSDLEWKPGDETETGWKQLEPTTVFEGDQTILVRRKASGTAAASEAVSYSFTADQINPSRTYIPLSSVNLESYSSAQTDKNGAAENILDGNRYTGWHTAWNGSDTERYLKIKFDEARYLTSIDYLPSGGNGTFQNVEVYTSMDGNSWILSGTASGWANNTEKKTLDLYAPVYTDYVMIKVTKGVNGFASGAMLEFFEDTTVENKKVERLELQSPPSKTEYMTGDELDLSGLSVKAFYDDGTYSSINTELLQFDPEVFRNTGEQRVQVSYRLDADVKPVSFEVNVKENTRTADSIRITQIPDQTRYFVGDVLDLTGLKVKAGYSDGSEGFLFEGQYKVTPEKLDEAGKAVPVTVSCIQDGRTLNDKFYVEVTKQVKEIKATGKPAKDSYNLGESFEQQGLEVTIVFTDGTEEILDPSEYSVASEGFSNTSGRKQLTVTYSRKPEIHTSVDVLVYPYITDGCLQFESDENADTAYVSGVVDQKLPEDGKITIPSQVTAAGKLKFTVTRIAGSAFADKTGITSVIIPDTVSSVDSGAFTGCSSLKEVYLTGYTDFDDFNVADDAFGPVNGEGAVQGTVYVADADLAQALKDKNMTGLKNFLIVPITEKMTGIRVTAPEKTEYHLGEELDLSGFAVTGILENGGELKLGSNLYTVSGFDSLKAGSREIVIAAAGTEFKDSFTVRVTPAVPRIEKQPESMTYDMTEFPEPLQVQASVSDAGHLQYQWYASADGEHYEALSSDTGTTCAVTPGETKYYYVKVTNNDEAGAAETAVSAESEPVKITFGNYEARIGKTAYATLSEAVQAAGEGNDGRVILIKNVSLDEPIRIDHDITLEGFGLYRKDTNKAGQLLNISAGRVTLKNIVLDGGAVWGGNIDPILNRGTVNSGITAAETMVLVSGGELRLGDGASLQNNDNRSAYGTNGGAVRVTNSGVLRIAGGQIVNNYCTPYGGAVLSIGSARIIVEKGRVSGNHGNNSGGTFCVDGNSSFVMNDSGDTNMPSIIEDNKGNTDGGVIWLKDGTAELNGGIIRNNRANSNGGAVYISGGGTVNLGNVIIEGNQAGGNGAAVHVNSGSLNITGCPSISDTVYLPSGKLIRIRADLTAVSQKIPVKVQNYQSEGARFATADSAELARTAEGAFTVNTGELPVYAYNGDLYYGNPTKVVLTKDLPETVRIMAGRQLTLSVEAEIQPADAGEPVYEWYRCSDAQGNGAVPVTVSQSGQGNVLSLGDCTEGVCYFYCEVSASNGKAEKVRSAICTVTVTKFVPASKAIEKINQL